MKKYAIITILLAVLLAIPSTAFSQRRKAKKNKTVAKKEEVVEDPRIAQMLASTQKIVFIDSIVVGLKDFMNHIPLTKECGKVEQKNGLGQYTNEMGDQRLTTVKAPNDTATHILSSYFIGNEWTKASQAKGIGNASANYPFMMPDGITLYYAQKGGKSIGGYDIFVTRYDAQSGSFLQAENMGMPFASKANDYFLAIDETHQLGYFVTDRRQPKGKVCIYVFIPNNSRRVYETEKYSEQKIRSLASINRIADTWGDKQSRKQAMGRYEEVKALVAASRQESRDSSTLLDQLRHQAEVLEKALTLARSLYARSNDEERKNMRDEILKNERELEQLQQQIKTKEKEERNKQYMNQ